MLFCAVLLLFGATHGAVHFGEMVPMGQIRFQELTENSGLGLSRVHDNIAYGHNDHGDTNRIFAFNVETGALVATLTINGAIHNDWEDLSVGPCGQGSNSSCIYIADIGSNRASHTVYKVTEPDVLTDSTLDVVDSLPFTWSEPDGEGVAVGPNGEVYVLSKVDGGDALFAKLPSSGWGASSPVTIPARYSTRLNLHTSHHDPLGADLSPDGKGLLIKCREDIFYYGFDVGQDLVAELRMVSPQVVNTYLRSENGQAVAWDTDGQGFYVLPEGRLATIDYYPVNGHSGPIIG